MQKKCQIYHFEDDDFKVSSEAISILNATLTNREDDEKGR